MAAVLIWARAVRAVCRQIASYVLAWEVSQPRVSLKSVTHCRATPAGFHQKWKSPTLGILWLVSEYRWCLGIAGRAARG